MGEPVNLYIPKLGDTPIPIDFEAISQNVYEEFLKRGAVEVLSTGLTSITKSKYPDPEALKAAVYEKVQENLANVLAGTVRFKGQKPALKISAQEKTEAMRLGRLKVKADITAAGGKIGHYAPSAITAAAKELLESPDGAELLALARQNLERATQVKVVSSAAKIKVDPKRVEAAEKAKREAQIKRDAKRATETTPKPAAAKGRKPKATADQVIAGSQRAGQASHVSH